MANVYHLSEGQVLCGEHNTAMEAPLRKFFFRSLISERVVGIQEFLRANAVDCIWARGLAHTPDELPPHPMPGTSWQPEKIELEPFNLMKAKASTKAVTKRN